MTKEVIGFNTSSKKRGISRCIKAGYFKMGLANLLYHPDDGFTAPAVLEYEIFNKDRNDKDS